MTVLRRSTEHGNSASFLRTKLIKRMENMNREIKIPKFLHELHGESAGLGSILAVYTTGLAGAGFCRQPPGFHKIINI